MDSIITKTKTIYPVSVTEAKRHLKVDMTNSEDDDYIANSIIKSATRYCENFIDKDIALTTNTLTIYNFYDNTITVNEGNLISITDISINGTLYTDYELEKYDDHFKIEWDDYKGGGDHYTLTMHFVTGYTDGECLEDLKQLICIKCGDFYDVERSSYTLGNIKKSDVVERGLLKYRAIRW